MKTYAMTDLALTKFALLLVGAFALMLVLTLAFNRTSFFADTKITDWLAALFTSALAAFTWALVDVASKQTEILSHTDIALNLAAKAQKSSAETAEKFRLFTEATDRAWIGPTSAGIDEPLKAEEPVRATVRYVNTGRKPEVVVVRGLVRLFSKAAWNGDGATALIVGFEQDCMAKPMPDGATNVAYPNTGFSFYQWHIVSNDERLPKDIRVVATDKMINTADEIFAVLECIFYGPADNLHHSAFCFFYKAQISIFITFLFVR
jgi:hypothetical protein